MILTHRYCKWLKLSHSAQMLTSYSSDECAIHLHAHPLPISCNSNNSNVWVMNNKNCKNWNFVDITSSQERNFPSPKSKKKEKHFFVSQKNIFLLLRPFFSSRFVYGATCDFLAQKCIIFTFACCWVVIHSYQDVLTRHMWWGDEFVRVAKHQLSTSKAETARISIFSMTLSVERTFTEWTAGNGMRIFVKF